MEQIIISNKRFVSADAEFNHYIVNINGTDVRLYEKKDGSAFGLSMKGLCKTFGYSTTRELKESEEWKYLNEKIGSTATESTLKAATAGSQPATANITSGYSSPAFWAGGIYEQAINLAENPYATDDVVSFLVTHGGLLVANQALIRGTIESNQNGNRIVIDPNTRSITFYNSNNEAVGSWSFSDNYCVMDMISAISALKVTPGYITLRSQNGKVDITPGAIDISQFLEDGQTEKTNFSINYMNTSGTLKIIAKFLPTTDVGLESGQIWRDNNGFLRIVQ